MQIIQKKITLAGVFSLLNLLLSQPNTQAHGIEIIPEITQAISLQAKYESGLPMQQAQIIVYAPNQSNEPWIRGMTNEEGKFIFIPDSKLSGNWQIKVSQAGHGNTINIPYFPTKILEKKPVPIIPNRLTNNQSNNPLISNITNTNSPTNLTILSENYQLQKSLMIASIVWGCVGTALFFTRTKSPSFSESKLSK